MTTTTDLIATLRGQVPVKAPGEELTADEQFRLAVAERLEKLSEALEEMLSVTNEHDDICSVGPLYNCTCYLQAAKQQARAELEGTVL